MQQNRVIEITSPNEECKYMELEENKFNSPPPKKVFTWRNCLTLLGFFYRKNKMQQNK